MADLEQKVADLAERLEGVENLLAGLMNGAKPDAAAAEQAERVAHEQHTPPFSSRTPEETRR
jgi:hypothetical protein